MNIHALPYPPGLELHRDDGSRLALHPLWLRERATDTGSTDPLTGQRLYDPSDLATDVRVREVRERSPGHWEIHFTDGALASLTTAQLLAELPGPDAGLPARRPWAADLASLPRVAWHPAPTDAALREITTLFLSRGFVIFSGVPRQSGAVLEVARTFGLPRDTNFGLMFDVRSQPQATDLAYTSLKLDPHTDNPYRDPVPGIQLLHCLVNESTGGLSTLVDGHAVVLHLRDVDPDALRILATTPVRFLYRDATTELSHQAPLIELDPSGELVTTRFSPRLDFVPLLPPEVLTAFYAARRTLDRLLRSTHFELRFLLQDGDLVMFDNRRLLHGRTAFDPQQGVRHLQGCYIDMDGVHSMHRVLHRGVPAASAPQPRAPAAEQLGA
jgi:gamma-butyrobetaine dioxygenase